MYRKLIQVDYYKKHPKVKEQKHPGASKVEVAQV